MVEAWRSCHNFATFRNNMGRVRVYLARPMLFGRLFASELVHAVVYWPFFQPWLGRDRLRDAKLKGAKRLDIRQADAQADQRLSHLGSNSDNADPRAKQLRRLH